MTRHTLLTITLVAAAATALSLIGFHRPPEAAAAEPPRTAGGKPIKALLVIGGCCHDYETQKDLLSRGLTERADVHVTVAFDPRGKTSTLNPVYDKDDWASGFDVIIHDECSADVKDLAIVDRILKPHRDGLPAVLLHCAMHSYRTDGFPDKDTPWFEFTGLATTGHGPHEPLTIEFVDADNPITRGLKGWTTGKEELYNNVRKPLPTTHALARGRQGDEQAVVVWTNRYGPKNTKVFATTLGHANELVGDARYLDLVTRGMLWSLVRLDEKDGKPAAASK